MEVVENLQEWVDEGEIYEPLKTFGLTIPPRKEDFLFNEDEYETVTSY